MVVFSGTGPRPIPGQEDQQRDFLPLPPGALRFNRDAVRALFDAIDTDKSGAIDVKELEVYFRNLAKNDAKTDPGGGHRRKDDAARMSRDLLEDCHAENGQVSYDNFQAFVLQREMELWSLFQTLDVSGDGRLDRDELKNALKEELELSLHEQNRFIESLEARSKEGKVDFRVFRDLFLLNPDEETSLAKAFRFYSATHRFGHSLFGADWVVLPQEAARAEELQSKIVLASGISAAVARLATAPLDRIRLFYQLGGLGAQSHRLARRGTRVHAGAAAARPTPFSRFLATIKQISKDGGLIRGLWRGTAVNLIKVPLESAFRVGALGFLRFKVAQREGCPDEPHDISRQGMLIAASLATGIAAVMLQPLDNIRTRMMSAVERIAAESEADIKALSNTGQKTAATTPVATSTGTRTFTQAANRIWQTQGLRGFWKGTTATMLSAVPFLSMSEALYDSLEKRWFDKNPPGPEGYKPPPIPLVLSMAATSAIVSELIFYPLLLVRSRMMAQQTPLHPYSYSSTWDCIKKTYQKNGAVGFYRGGLVTIGKALPTVVIGYASYELAKRELGMEWNEALGIWED